MPRHWRTIRVFISSTFRDMHAERDYLVKVAFPALREKLAAHALHLVDIDLRWGITADEAEHDRALDLCLQQIDECRPFFVGILGERYGWVPRQFSGDALTQYGWVQSHTGKSITELEIVYGVLRNPRMHGHAFFFFRDPSLLSSLPEALRRAFAPEDAESSGKLAALKDEVRRAGLPFPPTENYPCRFAGLRIPRHVVDAELNQADRGELAALAPEGLVTPEAYSRLRPDLRSFVEQFGTVSLAGLEVFGREVCSQLWNAIRQEYGLRDTPPAAEASLHYGLEEEQGDQERFIESRLQGYVGRDDLQDHLAAFLDGNSNVPCLVTGAPGIGKSAALSRMARWCAEHRPDVLLVSHFVGAGRAASTRRHLLRRMCLVLQNRFAWVGEVPPDEFGLIRYAGQLLAAVPATERVLWLVDGVDQLNPADGADAFAWLPRVLTPPIKVVVSCSTDAASELPPAVSRALALRPMDRYEMAPLTNEDRLEIVSRVPSLAAKKLDARQIDLLLANPATKNPLFMRIALEELRGFGSFNQLENRIAAFPREADTITAIFGQVIQRLREEFDPDVVRTTVALLACSRQGMGERELLEVIEGIGAQPEGSELFSVLRQLRPYLQWRGQLLDFFHDGLRKAACQRYLPDGASARAYHRELADYYHRKLNPTGGTDWSGQDPRGLSELLYHQACGQDWDDLENTLRSLRFWEARIGAGGIFDLADDLSAAVERHPADRSQHEILGLLQDILRRNLHFLERHSLGYPQAFFQCCWNDGWWCDCDELASHEARPLDGWGDEGPPWQRSGPKLSALVAQWRAGREAAFPGFPWVCCRRPPAVPLGTQGTTVLRGHEGTVQSVAFGPDGRRLASGGCDKTVRIWRVSNGAELTTLRGHDDWVTCVAFSADGTHVASGSRDGTVRLWDVDRGLGVRVLRGHNATVNRVAFSPDGRHLASAGDDLVRLWDVRSGGQVAELRGHSGGVQGVSFSPRGDRLASCCSETVRIWDAVTGREQLVLGGEPRQILDLSIPAFFRDVAFSPLGDSLVSGSPRTLHWWDASTGRKQAEWKCDYFCGLAFAPSGARIAIGCSGVGTPERAAVTVFDVALVRKLRVLEGHEGTVMDLNYSPRGDQIASASTDGTVRIWSAAANMRASTRQGRPRDVESVVPSTTTKQIATTMADYTIRLWDADTALPTAVLQGHGSRVNALAFSPCGRRIVSGAMDKTVRLWETASGSELAILVGHDGNVTSVAWAPDARRIASGSEDRTIRLFDAIEAERLALLRGRGVQSVTRSPAGNWAILCADNHMEMCGWGDEAALAVLEGHAGPVSCLAFLPDGARLISGSWDKTVRIWPAAGGRELAVLQGHEDWITCVACDPAGSKVASGARDGTVRVWDVERGLEVALLRGHTGGITELVFSDNGDRLASAGGDRTTRLWSTTTGQCLEVISASGDPRALTGGSPGTALRAWADRHETRIERADGTSVAWFPSALRPLVQLHSGHAWVGSHISDFQIIALEPGDSSTRAI
jgi:WD40 repeat protein